MKNLFSIIMLSLVTSLFSLKAQDLILPLYPEDNIPNAKRSSEKEESIETDIVRIGKVQVPNIAVYLPSKANRTGEAVVICPGGGYSILAYDWEGTDIAKFWNSKGIAAIVVKYRLPSKQSQTNPHEVPLMDVQRAIRMVRYHAEEWGIEDNKIGVMGFSAGGHLASSVSTHFDKGSSSSKDPVETMSCRPDFSLLIYPVITMTATYQHEGSRVNLVGEDKKLMDYFSAELQVTPETPPTFLVHASDDKTVPVENSLVYYQQLIKQGVIAEMHIYPEGGHGFSLALNKKHLSGWPERCFEFVKSLR